MGDGGNAPQEREAEQPGPPLRPGPTHQALLLHPRQLPPAAPCCPHSTPP